MRTKLLPILIVGVALGITGCSGSSTDSSQATGGSASATQGGSGSGGSSSVSSSSISVGGSSLVTSSSSVVTGGSSAVDSSAKGGASSTPPTTVSSVPGGSSAAGGSAMGGTSSVTPTTGGSSKGGTTGTTAGGSKTGGTSGTSSAGGGTTGTSPPSTGTVDCSATMPGGGTSHCGSYQTGKAGSLSYELWSNSYSSDACITTFSTPAFSAKWNNNSDFLARVGLDWGGGKTLDQLGNVTADLSFKKSGSAGGYSYIGIYGWSNEPCVEWYIIDDSFGSMPFNAYGMSGSGSATIDGETYKFFSGTTRGSGGSKCNKGESSWGQFWSIRQKARQCGTISISNHFNEWKKNNMALGKIIEAKILIEVGGGQGSIDFPVANVTAK